MLDPRRRVAISFWERLAYHPYYICLTSSLIFLQGSQLMAIVLIDFIMKLFISVTIMYRAEIF